MHWQASNKAFFEDYFDVDGLLRLGALVGWPSAARELVEQVLLFRFACTLHTQLLATLQFYDSLL